MAKEEIRMQQSKLMSQMGQIGMRVKENRKPLAA
jgi:hypothetical protein